MSKIKIPEKLVAEPCAMESGNPRHFAPSDDQPPQNKYQIVDPKTGAVWGYVVVDSTRRGPGLGGIRIAADLSVWEIMRLARTMTLKNSAANLPFGGAKSGIAFDPNNFGRGQGMKQDLIGAFAEAIFPIDSYIAAPDMSTDENDTQRIFQYNTEMLGDPYHGRGAAGRPFAKGGVPIDKWGLTGHSLYSAIKTLEGIDPNFQIKGARVVIQGFGNVGSAIGNKLTEEGALIVGASDVSTALWNAKGLQVRELNQARGNPKGLAAYRGQVDKRFSNGNVSRLLEAPCDILIPAARPDAITARNADRLMCGRIFQGANTPSNKMTEYYLENRRKILSYTDFIVNCGGVIGCAVEVKMTQDEAYRERVLGMGNHGRPYVENLIFETVSRNILTITKRLKERASKDIIFREEATRLAEERLGKPEEYWL
ncbi:Glu/Leu/Phe/Val family dehydrogenase [Nitrospina gracilis]|uniref:Glu/Leu/Phe/Val family dehydrogenase n=1 Tax=Nitrospina gracilis TaxID=35801 RepID=UPI001F16690D|nr:Glu/Leu/Phe/Val dehydrogenase dimerization domain-containing protein [Nitrospina gracilis]MCF8720661.1 glutamate dehydrogenase/leucine dehydrogenase [Nitrospina gracilis Nb-211]